MQRTWNALLSQDILNVLNAVGAEPLHYIGQLGFALGDTFAVLVHSPLQVSITDELIEQTNV